MPLCKTLFVPLLLSAMLMSGCAANFGGTLPVWAGGEPANVPVAEPVGTNYPAVHDLPPPRPTPLMSETEQTRVESDLTALRGRVNAEGEAVRHQRVNAQPAKPTAAAPANTD